MLIKELDETELLKTDFTFFVNFVHKEIFNTPFLWGVAQKKIKIELLKCYNLELEFLAINMPPRMGKTSLLSYFLAWTMAKDEHTFNNYYSGSDVLANKAYELAIKIMNIPAIKDMYVLEYKRNKENYSNYAGGGLFSMTINGQTIGMGAGTKTNVNNFNGCIVIDDPHKMQDSIIRISNITSSMKKGVLSRKNNDRVPVILVMQRVHKLDATNYLLNFYADKIKVGKGKHLKIPVWDGVTSIDSVTYPIEAIEREIDKDNNYYWTQLMQDPRGLKGVYFKENHFDVKANESLAANMIINFDNEDINQPVVFLAFNKIGDNFNICDYAELQLDTDNFYSSISDFAELNQVDKILIPKNLYSEVLEKSLEKFEFKKVDIENNLKLESYYIAGLCNENKILLSSSFESEPLKEELKLYPNSERDFAVKAVISAFKFCMLNSENSISLSL